MTGATLLYTGYDIVSYVNCTMDTHIAPVGWNVTGGNPPGANVRPSAVAGWREYRSRTPGGVLLDVSQRLGDPAPNGTAATATSSGSPGGSLQLSAANVAAFFPDRATILHGAAERRAGHDRPWRPSILRRDSGAAPRYSPRRMEANGKPVEAPRPRLLIFVIAYYAESTLASVLKRIPATVFEDFDCEVLIVDDASEDKTFEIGHEYRAAHPEIPMVVLRNTLNQGYGGNQKVGYTYAIAKGFDFVAMVHGDGQYAPEELPRLMQPLVAGEADAVFGSRMMEKFGALRGGMPLYKYVGNKILTASSERAAGHEAVRVPQRLSHLLDQGSAARAVPPELERFSLRHRDHHPAAQRRPAHRRAADPHLLRRRDLPRERHEVRQGRAAGGGQEHRAPFGPALSAPLRSGHLGQYALLAQARVPEQPFLRAGRRSRRRARAGHRRRPGRHGARAGQEGL